MLTDELRKQIRSLQWQTKRHMNAPWLGAYASAFKGAGVEFEGVRAYTPGDDLRRIDHNVSARMLSPYVKLFGEERSLTFMILVDVSASVLWGHRQATKLEAIQQIAHVLAYLAHVHQDRVGMIVFSDQIESVILPGKGPMHLWRCAKALVTPPRGQGTFLDGALVCLKKVVPRSCLVLVLSDFLDASAQWTSLSRHYDFWAFHIQSPVERLLPKGGLVTCKDPETGLSITIDSSSSKVQTAYQTAYASHQAAWQKLWQSTQTPHIDLDPDHDPVRTLFHFLQTPRRL